MVLKTADMILGYLYRTSNMSFVVSRVITTALTNF